MKIDWVRNEIARMRGAIGAQEREIRMLQRAVASTVSAEAPLARMRKGRWLVQGESRSVAAGQEIRRWRKRSVQRLPPSKRPGNIGIEVDPRHGLAASTRTASAPSTAAVKTSA
jgi:hypothetical protein